MSRPIARNYSFAPERVFVAAVQAVQSFGYKIDKIDKANGLLTFRTGMSRKSWQGQEMSLVVLDVGDNTTNVSITGQRISTNSFQLIDYNEAEGIAKQVLEKME